MDAHKPSFMLLPDFTFAPDQDLKLGTLLASNKATKLPDPRRPLNTRSHIPIKDASISRQRHTPWSFADSRQLEARIGLHAGLSFIPLAGGNLGGGRGKEAGISIICDEVSVETFNPDKEYFDKSLARDLYRSYGGGFGRPSLWMITGIMVAKGSKIKLATSASVSTDLSITADASFAGFPGQVGPELLLEKCVVGGKSMHFEKPFILAYQLRRIRLKTNGLYCEVDENRWALFDDCDVKDVEQVNSRWDIVLVTEDIELST